MAELLDDARRFAANAEVYVHWFDRAVSDETTNISLRKLHKILSLLQAAAACLTGVAPGDEAGLDFEKNRDNVCVLRKKLPVDAYAVVSDPLEYDPTEANPPTPVMATISDDLSDIYHDLIEGLALLQNGRVESALWHWHFTYYTHWGRHLSHAQSARVASIVEGFRLRCGSLRRPRRRNRRLRSAAAREHCRSNAACERVSAKV
jgi:hypothetical protein